ncbi:hypothetical protein HanRHA438_Chr08g0372001 [Helianthus annuus]|nr:hypothetical protein HanIR_Chr08g0388601 [Helianthus annuus]KAJ0899734.1 hypothetical protein HanRHA438_Chr08g0372001 [Helianthus annuus]
MGMLNPSTRLTAYEDWSRWLWWRLNWAKVAGAAPPRPLHSSLLPQSPVAQVNRLLMCLQPVRAQIRPDQWAVGAGKERWERGLRAKPPRSRTGWPELGWMAGQMG